MLNAIDFTNPVNVVVFTLLAGFGLVAAAKLFGLFFMRWRTPFRLGDQMKYCRAEVVEWSGGEGTIRADGEIWRALSKQSLNKGDQVIITRVDGLTLEVKKR